MPKPRSTSKNRPLKTLRIFCEGANTEPEYINSYIQEFLITNRARVVKVEPTKKNTPVQLVQEAVDFKRSPKSLPHDEFWVVYDRESIARYDRNLHLKAWNNANRNGINVALSNVCFEYWLLLHFLNSAAAYSSYDDLYKNSPLNTHIMRITGRSYTKADKSLFSKLLPLIPSARDRAITINNTNINAAPNGALPFDINPYTNVPDLLEAIVNFK